MTVKHRKFMILAVALVALNSFFWLAGPSLGLTKAIVNQFFGNRLIRAEVVLQGINGQEDWLIDRGVIKSISGPSLTLIEGDGRLVTVVVDQNARVQGPFRFGSVAKLRPHLRVVTYHQANVPVQLIQVEGVGG
jgi:hypothetical protein